MISVVYLGKAALLEAGGVVITSSLWEQLYCFKGVLCKCDKCREIYNWGIFIHSGHPNLCAGNILRSKCPKAYSSVFGKVTESLHLPHEQKLQSASKDTVDNSCKISCLCCLKLQSCAQYILWLLLLVVWGCVHISVVVLVMYAPNSLFCTPGRQSAQTQLLRDWMKPEMSCKSTVNGIWLLGGVRHLGQTRACLKVTRHWKHGVDALKTRFFCKQICLRSICSLAIQIKL